MENNAEWIDNIIASARTIVTAELQDEFILTALEIVFNKYDRNEDRQLVLAALFDLLVSCEYYRFVAHNGWLYCPDFGDSYLFYPYNNICPRCVMNGNFIFHNANKPRSGVIGNITATLLAAFLKKILERKSTNIDVLIASEPVDIVIVDKRTSPKTVFLAEIKSAPLLTLPLCCQSQRITQETETGIEYSTEHKPIIHSQLIGENIEILIPYYDEEKQLWQPSFFNIGRKNDLNDNEWAYQGVLNLLKSNDEFLHLYIKFWIAALKNYERTQHESIFWLTNACGQPFPRPMDWPTRNVGTGHESISDSKTSVGMDRTDDLKKATYQVLKISTTANPNPRYNSKVGIISNIHAVRHHDAYLTALQDVIWTRDTTGTVKKAKDLPNETELFNLFDGIVSFTKTIARDNWVRDIFSLE